MRLVLFISTVAGFRTRIQLSLSIDEITQTKVANLFQTIKPLCTAYVQAVEAAASAASAGAAPAPPPAGSAPVKAYVSVNIDLYKAIATTSKSLSDQGPALIALAGTDAPTQYQKTVCAPVVEVMDCIKATMPKLKLLVAKVSEMDPKGVPAPFEFMNQIDSASYQLITIYRDLHGLGTKIDPTNVKDADYVETTNVLGSLTPTNSEPSSGRRGGGDSVGLYLFHFGLMGGLAVVVGVPIYCLFRK